VKLKHDKEEVPGMVREARAHRVGGVTARRWKQTVVMAFDSCDGLVMADDDFRQSLRQWEACGVALIAENGGQWWCGEISARGVQLRCQELVK
jgi:hypothetical protein